jgi:aminoglycoside phosphotransferase
LNYPVSGPALAAALWELLGPKGFSQRSPGEVSLEALPSSRAVYRLTCAAGKYQVVGKFFSAFPPATSPDRSLLQEYDNYLRTPELGLSEPSVPRLLGRCPEVGLGLLLESVTGPDLDQILARAIGGGDAEGAENAARALTRLARLLAYFHSRPLAAQPVAPEPACRYLEKVLRQLDGMGLLSPEDQRILAQEATAWQGRFAEFPDRQVMVHGDATPTNFLFPDGRAVALDLERLRAADRLWDLSWVAGELKHAWGWRAGNFHTAEGAIRHFFQAYRAALPVDPVLTRRLHYLNPFYMALAELRIARNGYLSWDYRRELLAEARRCLAGGRRL